MFVRKAQLSDLPVLIQFTLDEAVESEGVIKDKETLSKGIETALKDPSIASYWVLIEESERPVGSISIVREWSDWHAGYYWWVQSMYVSKPNRGKGLMKLLLDAVSEEMKSCGGLELRLYVHKNNVMAKNAYIKAGFYHSDYEIMTLSQ